MKRLLAAVFILIACSLAAQNLTRNSIGMEFVRIGPGEFMMGCSIEDNECNADEKPAHPVQISKTFEIGKFEVTQAQWQSVMASNPSTIKGDDKPVETVSKDEAHEFMQRLNARNDGYRYRLPTEAEWEYAARAGTKGAYAGKLTDIAWYADNSEDETHPVGKKKPNAWGLYDMHGNVREWVEDFYGRNYYSSSPAADPTGPAAQAGGCGFRRGGPPRGFDGPFPDGPPPDGAPPDGPPRGFGGRRGGPPPDGPPPDGPPRGFGGRRGPGPGGRRGGPDGRGGPNGPGGGPGQLPVMRGGAWDNPASFLRVSARYNYYGSTLRFSDVGFRVVREPVAQ